MLVHGFTATWRCWMPVVGELVPRFDVIAPTLHGHDGGPQPAAVTTPIRSPTPPTTSSACSTISASTTPTSRATRWAARCRSSWPSAAELAASWRSPPAAAGTPATPPRPTASSASSSAATHGQGHEPHLPRVMRRPGVRRLALRDVMACGDLVPPARGRAARAVLPALQRDRRRLRRDAPRHARISDLDQVHCPTLVVWGTRDRILPLKRHAERFRTEIPGVQFRVLPGLGHTPMWDDPGLIAATIGDWVSTSAAQAGVQRVEETAQRERARRRRGRRAASRRRSPRPCACA